MTYKDVFIEGGWAKAFLSVITEDDAERLSWFKDVDEQLLYADYLAMKYHYDGEYFEGDVA